MAVFPAAVATVVSRDLGDGALVVARLVKLDSNGEASPKEDLDVPLSGALIGRKENCSIKLECPTVSGEQCLIRWNNELLHFEIEDRSSNGTFLNNRLIGRFKVLQLTEGDTVRFTKRKETGLLYRFQTVSAAPAAGAAAPPAVPGARRLPPASSSALPARMESGAAEETDLVLRLRSRVAAEERRISGLAAELRSVASGPCTAVQRPPWPASGPGGSREGLRAAEEEALQEAERAHLMRQRSVLETEVLQRQVDHQKLELALRRAEAVKQRERDERMRLEGELQVAIDGHAVVSGHIEGYQEHLSELQKAHQSMLQGIAPARSRTEGLRTQLLEAQAELARAHAAEEEVPRKTMRVEAALSTLVALAADLGNDMRSDAQVLSDCIHTSTGAAAADHASTAAPAAERQGASRCSRSPAALEGSQRTPLREVSCKENVSPPLPGRRRSSGSSAPPQVPSDGSSPRRVSSRAAGGSLATGGEAKRRRHNQAAPESLSHHQPEVDDDPLGSFSASASSPLRPPSHADAAHAASAPLPGALAAAAAARRARPRLWAKPGVAAPLRLKTAAATIEDLCSPEH